jgi:hypothetical protein
VTLKDLEKRLEKEPDNLPLRVTVAGMLSSSGRKADAVEHYRRVAHAYRAQGRLQQALAVARSILELAPNDAAIHALVGELTEVKPPAPAPEERKPSVAEPTKTGVRAAPEPKPAVEVPVPDLDDLDTKPPGATGSRPPGTMPQRVTRTGLRPIPVTTTKGPKSTPPVIRIPEKKSDSQPPATATFRAQPPPPPRRSPFPEDITDPHSSRGAPRRSSFDIPTPLPQPVPYHMADPTSSQDRISRDDVPGLDEALETRPGDEPNQSGGLAQAARRISSLIKPRSEKPTRNPFTPDPTLRPDAPEQPAPARTAKPVVDPYADKPIVPRSDKPTRQPPIGRPDKATQNPFSPDKLVAPARLDKLPSIARPGSPTSPPPPAPSPAAAVPPPQALLRPVDTGSRVPLRPDPAPTLPARSPPVTSTSKTQPRPAQPRPPDDASKTQPRPAQAQPASWDKPPGETFRSLPPPAGPAPMLPVSRPPLRPSQSGPTTIKAQPPPAARATRPTVPQPARDTNSSGVRAVPRAARDTGSGSSGTRVDNLPPAPEPGADHLPPPPAAPPRAASVVPRTPSYSDEIVAELDTRERPRLSSEQLDKIASPPPTVPTEQIVLDDDHVTPVPEWPDRRARKGGPPIRDTPMDPPTDVHATASRDTSLDMHTEAGTDVRGAARGAVRDTRPDAAAEPPEDERTAPRELVGPEPLANAFFLPIPLNRRDAALTRCIRRIVRAGQTVIRQGETSHPLYLVVTGQLELQIERANGTLSKLDEIDAGQFIGEGSLLARTPAIAHVVASANSELLALPPHALFELAGAYPALWAALKESAERRTRMYEKLLQRG